MNQRYFLYLIATVLFLLIVISGFASWKFLIENVDRTREINIGTLELPDVDMERYNKLVKKGL